MNNETYLEPNRKAQIGAFFFLALCIAFPGFVEFLLPQIAPYPNSSEEEFEAFSDLLKLIMYVVYVVHVIFMLLMAIYSILMGYRTLKLGCYPPPGTILLIRARIYTGKQAAFWGYISISLGVFLALFEVILSFYAIPFIQEAFSYSFGDY